MLPIGLSCVDFILLRYIPSIASFFRTFIITGSLTLSKAFSVPIEMILWFLSLLCYMLYFIYWFAYIEPSLYPWNETKLIMVYDRLIVCWSWFAVISFRFFASKFIKVIGLCFSFLVVSLSGFGMSLIVALLHDFGRMLSIPSSWNSLRHIGVSTPLEVWQNWPENQFSPRIIFVWRLLLLQSHCLLLTNSGCLYPLGSILWNLFV
jgi:hypothetical protein